MPALTRELSLSEPVPTTDSCKRGIARSFPIESVTFPFVYELDCGIGISESRDWRVVAFLHRDTAQADAIAGGEWFGTSDFAVDDCGLLTGGYCGITQDIDVVIDDQAP